MAKPYRSDFKIITAVVQVPKYFGFFAVNMADFNSTQLILLKRICLLRIMLNT